MRIPLACVLLFISGCAPAWQDVPHGRLFQRVAPPVAHRLPQGTAVSSDWWDHALHAFVVPVTRLVSPARYLDHITQGREALDVNDFDEVLDSTWFTNRIGRAPVALERIRHGEAGMAPAPGPLTVISGKTEGATPGIVVRDSANVVWFAKFDPPAYPELTTGAEVVAARLLWAAGYNVLHTHLLTIDLSRLRLDQSAKTRNQYNQWVPLTEELLSDMLIQLNPNRWGQLRAVFSRAAPGHPLGPFSYRGARPDDPNDRIPHERRRSLRGLWVFSAWLNNTDTRRQNTLDTFVVTEPVKGLGHVRHHLIDFGDALGAAGSRQKYLGEGYEYFVDWTEIGGRFLGLGLAYPYWLLAERTPYRAIGLFEGKVFDPERWRSVYPNPAFDEATARDTYWAASILARFTPAVIAAGVAAAGYSKPEVGGYITRVLLERRDKILQHAFKAVLPLSNPTMEGPYELSFIDLARDAGLAVGNGELQWELQWSQETVASGRVRTPRFDLENAVKGLPKESAEDPFVALTIARPGDGPSLTMFLRVIRHGLMPVGLRRSVK